MSVDVSTEIRAKPTNGPRRFASLDFARGLAIFLMIGMHTLNYVLSFNGLLDKVDEIPIINLLVLVIVPFYGGLAGFFLLVSSTSNMVSMYRNLEKGLSIRNLVIKQVFSGILLLFFAMVCESLTGFHGAFGEFFKFLDNPASYFPYNPLANLEHWDGTSVKYNWQVLLYRWNHFETIHTIAWCLILNGIIQGILSLKGQWKNRRRLIITYAGLAVAVVLLTQPVWELVKLIIPGYPFGSIPETGHVSYTPVVGLDVWWRIISAPFLSALAAPMEPLFPYLAISFVGSIIGIVITRPREEINKNFPRNMFLIGLTMFITGLIGIVILVIQVMNATDIYTAIEFYKYLPSHRHMTPDFQVYFPLFAWVPQFLCLNGYSIMLLMFLFRMIEFRGISKVFSDRTKAFRRFGTVAFSNYNNQSIIYIIFFFISWMLTSTPYTKLFWGGTILTIFVILAFFMFMLIGWEKIGYIGSLEWIIRLVNNNLIPANRMKFGPEVKWWQKGSLDIDRTFHNPHWVDLAEPIQEKENNEEDFTPEQRDSKLALILSVIGLVTIIFNAVSIFGIFVSLRSRKLEGKNKRNTAALVLSFIGVVFFIAFYIVCSIVKIGSLGLPL